jgi:hypothetical protein
MTRLPLLAVFGLTLASLAGNGCSEIVSIDRTKIPDELNVPPTSGAGGKANAGAGGHAGAGGAHPDADGGAEEDAGK